MTISIEEYRKIMKDEVSPDALITKRLQFIEEFCNNIINVELDKYYDSIRRIQS